MSTHTVCGFFISILLSRKHTGIFVRSIYIISSIWLGLFYFLLIATCVISVLPFILTLLHIAFNFKIIGTVIYSMALGVSIFGFINLQRPKVTHIEIPIKNIPESWLQKKVIFFADSHFGNIFNLYHARKLAVLIESLQPDIVLIGGDFFDGPKIDFFKIAEQFKDLTTATKHGVYFVSGNHESYEQDLPYFKALKQVGIQVLVNEKVEIEGVEFIGLDYLSSDSPEKERQLLVDLLEGGNKRNLVNNATPRILIKHVPVDLKVAYETGIDVHLSGHTHRGQVWPFSLLTKKMYKGYDFGLHDFPKVERSSTKPHKNNHVMKAYTTSGAYSWGPPYRIGTKNEIVVIKFVRI